MHLPSPDDARKEVPTFSTQLAYDLASGLWEKKVVLEKYDVDAKEWDRLRNNKLFQKVLKEAVLYWNGNEGIDRRIQAKAKVMLEDSLPVLHALANDSEKAGMTRMAAIDRMNELSGAKAAAMAAAQKQNALPPGSGITIQIDLGGGNVVDFNTVQPAEKTIEHTDVEDAEELD